jgi:hypothetical protein
MKKSHGHFKGTTLGTITILVLATGCTDLKSVEEFGKSSAKVKAAVILVSSDAYQSCLRTARQYRRPTTGTTVFPAATSFEFIRQAENACDKKKEDAALIANANATLTDYMAGLGKLASDDTVKFEQNLDGLEKSIKGLTGLAPNAPTDKVDAGIKIARFIFNQFVLAFKKENIEKAILCADESISEYTEGLQFVAREYYINGTLRNERTAMDNYYQSLKPDISAQPSQASERIATFLLRRQYGEELVALSDREQAGRAYIQLLSETAKTHNDLRGVFALRKNMNKQNIKDFCKPIFTKKDSSSVTALLPSPAATRPMLAGSEAITPAPKAYRLTPVESKEIAQILQNYQRRVELLALEITRALGSN